jgi:hypothetical protein
MYTVYLFTQGRGEEGRRVESQRRVEGQKYKRD